ncbi:hypothetical protein C7974DRAFT_422835 [Boeremia exigua]|uniref:uncharacterized protein n=1 Tax=Boeremia exigua TaxID=749465 RepID=UPI001E8CF195|nr:uncharacterized protein C7974DRAFT_422835 [Boeremia exigua]KAH6637876.1 hypothetical protein C7974DRAFT_422835 [Boeremia exigua]
MPPIGPAMPPQPSKRSRDDDDTRSSSPDASDKRRRVAGPALPPAAAPRTAGPTLPPTSTSRSSSPDSDAGPAPPPPSRPARVMGPAAPPAPLSERPPNPPPDSDSSDSDFGPAPPPAGASYSSTPVPSAFDSAPQLPDAPRAAQRDEWMTLPPTADGLASRLDPSKPRARKFNTGKSAASGPAGISSAWTETPAEKLKRLQNEALGIAPAEPGKPSGSGSARRSKEDERARAMRDRIDATRGKSLVEQHQGAGKVAEDDPSKRVFDYEKDMAVQADVSRKQKKDIMGQSKGFGDRFAGGRFL